MVEMVFLLAQLHALVLGVDHLNWLVVAMAYLLLMPLVLLTKVGLDD